MYANNLIPLRKRSGKTIDELALRTGVEVEEWKSWEDGRKIPSRYRAVLRELLGQDILEVRIREEFLDESYRNTEASDLIENYFALPEEKREYARKVLADLGESDIPPKKSRALIQKEKVLLRSEQVRTVLKAQRMKQKEAADSIGMSHGLFYQKTQGNRPFRNEELQALADLFGFETFDDLVESCTPDSSDI